MKVLWTETAFSQLEAIYGINVGIILLSAENMRTGNIWRWFMQNPEVPTALTKVGLSKLK